MSTFIAKGLNFLFSQSTAPGADQPPEPPLERGDAGNPGSTYEHPHHPRANRHPNSRAPSSRTKPARRPISVASTSPDRQRLVNRRRDSRSEDEKRLTGDFTIPADALILPPPTANGFMKRTKPISGGHRPMNTLGGSKISDIEAKPRPAQKTYGNIRKQPPRPLELPGDRISDCSSQLSPPKRRKIDDTNAEPIYIREDDTPQSTIRRQLRPQDVRRNSRDAVFNNLLGLSEFQRVEEEYNGTSKSSQTYNARRHLLTTSKGDTRRPTAGSRGVTMIEIPDDDEPKRRRSPISHEEDVFTTLSSRLEQPSPRKIEAGHHETHGKNSPYFPTDLKGMVARQSKATNDAKADLLSDPKKYGVKQPRQPSPKLQDQFIRDEDAPDELLMDPKNSAQQHPVNLNRRPPKTVRAAQSQRRVLSEEKTVYRLDYFATHGIVAQGPGLTMPWDADLNTFLVQSLATGSSTNKVLSTVNPAKIIRRFECPETRTFRLTGSRTGTLPYWFDLQFARKQEFQRFLMDLPDLGVKRIQKSRTEMDKIFRRPASDVSHQPPVNDQEMDLLAAKQQRRLQEPDHSCDGPDSRPARKRLAQNLQASAPGDNPTKKPRINVVKIHDEELESRPPAGRRNTRASLNSNPPRVYHDPSPSPVEYFPHDQRYSVNPGLGKEWEKPVEFPPAGRRRATVPFSDLERLDDGQFLNDALIEFYMLWAYEQAKLPPNLVYLFNTYFYATLSKKQKGATGVNYNGVARWVKDDIFSYDYAVIPVNEDAHWYVAIICNLRNVESVNMKESSTVNDVGTEPVQLEGGGEQLSNEDEVLVTETPRNSPGSRSPPRGATDRETSAPATSCEQAHTPAEDLLVEPEAANPEAGEWLDTKENPKSQSGTPFRDTSAAVQKLSLQDDVSGSNPETPSLRQSMGNAKGKRKPPPQRKYDPNQPMIIILDSLEIKHTQTVRNLKDYIAQEGKAKRDVDTHIEQAMNAMAIPRQSNYCDCGVFLLCYLKAFFNNPKEFVTKILTREMDVEKDWTDANPSAMRTEIRNILFQLHDEQEAVRKEQKILKKKLKKESPARKDMKEVEKSKDVPETVPLAKKFPSPAKQPPSPKAVIPVNEPAESDSAPVPSAPIPTIEEHDITPSSPTLASGTQDEAPSSILVVDGHDPRRIGSTIPETPSEREVRLGSEQDPIEIVDTQLSIADRSAPRQRKVEKYSDDSLFAQLEHASTEGTKPVSKTPKSQKKRRVIDVDNHTSFDTDIESLELNAATNAEVRSIEKRDRTPTRRQHQDDLL